MKRTLLSRRNALLSPSGVSAGVVILFIAIALLLLRLIFPGALVALATPFLSFGQAISARLKPLQVMWVDTSQLARERDSLAEQLSALALQNQSLQAVLDDTTKLIGKIPAPVSGVLAGVVARPPLSGYDILVVNVGTSDGVFEGMRAFANGGVPIGVVESSTQNSARVVLFSAAGTTHPVWVGEGRTPATLAGHGAGAFSTSVPKAAEVAVGDIVYATGPGALPLAIVRRVDSDASSATATLYAAALVNAFSLTWVELRP